METHGFFRGARLGVVRICRCNPWCASGHDPVPLPDGYTVSWPKNGAIVLTAARHLQEITPLTGEVAVDFPLAVGTEKLDWRPGLFDVSDGYVAVERLTAGGPADPDAPDHYFTPETVVLAAL